MFIPNPRKYMWVRYKGMWLLSYFKRSVGNCHSALRRGIQYKKHNKKSGGSHWIPRRSAEWQLPTDYLKYKIIQFFISKRGLFISNSRDINKPERWILDNNSTKFATGNKLHRIKRTSTFCYRTEDKQPRPTGWVGNTPRRNRSHKKDVRRHLQPKNRQIIQNAL